MALNTRCESISGDSEVASPPSNAAPRASNAFAFFSTDRNEKLLAPAASDRASTNRIGKEHHPKAKRPKTVGILSVHQTGAGPRRRKACYRPAGLRFDRAGFAPAGQILQISERYRSRSSFRTSLSWSLP